MNKSRTVNGVEYTGLLTENPEFLRIRRFAMAKWYGGIFLLKAVLYGILHWHYNRTDKRATMSPEGQDHRGTSKNKTQRCGVPSSSQLWGSLMENFDEMARPPVPERPPFWSQYADDEELWFDVMGDTGDGFNPTYSVASLLAQPALHFDSLTRHGMLDGTIEEHIKYSHCPGSDIILPDQCAGCCSCHSLSDTFDGMNALSTGIACSYCSRKFVTPASDFSLSKRHGNGHAPDVESGSSALVLKRGKFMVLAGDLAYPYPTPAAYQHKLFDVFALAMAEPASSSCAMDGEGEGGFSLSDGEELTEMGDRRASNSSTSDLEEACRPECFAIPGNHDWYDGLDAFSRFVLGREYLGGWGLPQRKASYFALALPHGWWLFGIDIGPHDDLDQRQLSYFEHLVKHMHPTERVILVLHSPDWVLVESPEAGPPLVTNLRQNVLKDKLVLTIAGDMHHYRRFQQVLPGGGNVDDDVQPHVLLIHGGGGAFLHATHIPSADHAVLGFDPRSPRTDNSDNSDTSPPAPQQHFKGVVEFPSKQLSEQIGGRILYDFRFHNHNYGYVLAIGYTLFFLELTTPVFSTVLASAPELVRRADDVADLTVLKDTTLTVSLFILMIVRSWFQVIWHLCSTPTGVLSQVITFASFVGMCDTRYILSRLLSGMAHGLGHFLLSSSLRLVYEVLYYVVTRNAGGLLAQPVHFDNATHASVAPLLSVSVLHTVNNTQIQEGIGFDTGGVISFYYCMALVWMMFGGYFVGPYTMGLYLATSMKFFGLQWNEAFSSMRGQDYKGFLRLHITREGQLDVYPIGVRYVPRAWEFDPLHREGCHKPAHAQPFPSVLKAAASTVPLTAELIEPSGRIVLRKPPTPLLSDDARASPLRTSPSLSEDNP